MDTPVHAHSDRRREIATDHDLSPFLINRSPSIRRREGAWPGDACSTHLTVVLRGTHNLTWQLGSSFQGLFRVMGHLNARSLIFLLLHNLFPNFGSCLFLFLCEGKGGGIAKPLRSIIWLGFIRIRNRDLR